jgi:hypothetical protein
MAEEDSSFESTLDELESLFHLATEFVRDLRDLKNEEKLKFYGLFKQVSILKCTNFEMYESIKCILIFTFIWKDYRLICFRIYSINKHKLTKEVFQLYYI